MALQQIVRTLGASLDAPPGAWATGWSIDSRTIKAGDVFFAIAGTRRDGHDFVERAFAAGAVAAVVRRGWSGAAGRLVIPVDEPAEAPARLARKARRGWGGRLVAVTGSNGKTTTKDAAAALLAARLRTSKSEGNLNNELGLPLSLLRIDDEAEAAVVEMGMNHAGEIRRLALIAAPDVGVVTNVSAAHIGAFRSIDEVARAKRELIEELGAEGTAVLNADDKRVRRFAEAHRGRTVTFGVEGEADFRATEVETRGFGGSRFRLRGRLFHTRLPGRHNVVNLTAAIAVAATLGVAIDALPEAVAALAPAEMRGRVREIGGVTILDDCYNSNPAGVEAMLALLAETPARRRVAVLGEMRELGTHAAELHRAAGARAAESGVDLLIAVSGEAREMVAGAVATGLPGRRAEFFADAEQAGAALRDLLEPGDAVLFKASRGVGLERALARVGEKPPINAVTG